MHHQQYSPQPGMFEILRHFKKEHVSESIIFDATRAPSGTINHSGSNY